MESLITDIEAFCAEHDLTDGQFGLLALNDKNFLNDLREGRDIRLSTAQRVTDFMATYRSDKADAA